MKIKSYALIGVILFALVGVRADEPAKAEPAAPAKTDYKDAFLQLALEKTKLYSGKIEGTVEKAVDITMKEAPEVAKEYLRWKFWENIVRATAIFMASIILTLACVMFVKKGMETRNESAEGPLIAVGVIAGVIDVFVLAALFFEALPSALAAVEIAIAPRVYLIEQLGHLLK
jgi:hypothetical protein